MGKKLIITEKPSVAREFAKALGEKTRSFDGYLESEGYIITWCIGHLVGLCYPEAYDPALKRWSMSTIPFIPAEFKYQIIDSVSKQFNIIKRLFHREDVDIIYNAGDSGREGEYIQRLVKQEAGCRNGIVWKRVWIDSQTEEEILRGIREARDESAYDNLAASAYLRAKEDYLMGINFSRVLTLKYGDAIKRNLNSNKAVVAVGRVMTCVQGLVVDREREIRAFNKTPFYKVICSCGDENYTMAATWKATADSKFMNPLLLYKDIGFLKKESAEELISYLGGEKEAVVSAVSRKKQTGNPPLLFNLAELQNHCSKLFKISPDETLKITQELYEKKLVTYPRTDARVLSTAVSKEIHKNIKGLCSYDRTGGWVNGILEGELYRKLGKRYVDDKQITDHYAIIPTGQGLAALKSLDATAQNLYEVIVRRFLAIFYEPSIHNQTSVTLNIGNELFGAGYKTLVKEGYLSVMKYSFADRDKEEHADRTDGDSEENQTVDGSLSSILEKLKKGSKLNIKGFSIKEGETTPPKRYNSGSIILAMENAGQLIEDEELRAQIKGSGIGTSATRAEILKKLVNNGYLKLNKKTQIITPTLMGEIIYECVKSAIRPLLDPQLTASWEKGLSGVANGEITPEEYMEKLESFVVRRTNTVKAAGFNRTAFQVVVDSIRQYYK